MKPNRSSTSKTERTAGGAPEDSDGKITRPAGRIAAVDFARFIAIAAVVWHHTPETAEAAAFTLIGRSALPFFAAASSYFLTRSLHRNPDKPFSAFLRSRLHRIYLPFLAWSLVYWLFRNLKKALITHEAGLGFDPAFFITGTSAHLWFLPFILAFGLLFFFPVKTLVRSPRNAPAAALFFALAGIGITFVPPPSGFKLAFLAERSLSVLPAALWGIALAAVLTARKGRSRAGVWSGTAALAGTAVLNVLLIWSGPRLLIENAGGLLFLVFGLRIPPVSGITAAAPLGDYAYGIYLVHMLWVYGLQAVRPVLGIPPSPAFDLAVFVFSLAASLAVAAVLRRNPRLKGLAP